MSHVASTVVWTMLEEDEAMSVVNEWLEEQYGTLTHISSAAGGRKAFQAQLWAGGLNYLDIPAFLHVVFAAPWRYPEAVRVIIEDEHDDWPTMYSSPLPASEADT